MSSQITTAFVQQYSSNVFHLSQQKGSRLRGCVRVETVNGKTGFFDRIGLAVAQQRVSRHSDTPQIDTPHSRRMVALSEYEYADLIDDPDKIKLLMDPTGPYTEAAVWSLGRVMDDVILDNMSSSAATGETGSSSTSLGNGQKIAAISGGAGSKLNVSALRAACRILNGNDVDESIARYCALNAIQLEALLGQTEVTSADFNSVRALVMGEMNTFLGLEFKRTQRINNVSSSTSFSLTTGAVGSGSGDSNGYNKVMVWAKDGMLLGLGSDIKARIAERADKSFSMQVYAAESIGGVRMEEEKVVEVHCATA